MAFITGTSNYPGDFDVDPTGLSVNPSLEFVLDEIRDGVTGVVTQSGNKVVAIDVNSIYSITDKIERVLGTNPQDTFDTVASRLNYLAYSGVLAFLPITGGSMAGALTVPSGLDFNVHSIISSGLNWTITTGTASINAQEGLVISSSGDATIDASNLLLAGVLIEGTGNNISFIANSAVLVSGQNSTTIYGSGNQIVVSSGQTTITKRITPTVAESGTVDLGTVDSYFGTIYADNLNAGGVSLEPFLPSTGGNVTGDVTITGSNLNLKDGSHVVNDVSGINNMGSSDYPFGDIYTKTINASFVSGLSPITFLSDIILDSGSNFTFSGTDTIMGSVSTPLDTLYVTTIIGATGLDANTLVHKSGSNIFGDINFTGISSIVLDGTGNNISVNTSGTVTIASTGNRLSGIYTDTINDQTPGNMMWNEESAGTLDGVNKVFTLTNSPVLAHQMVFLSGILINPATDYVMSSNTITIQAGYPAPTTASGRPRAGFYIY